MAGAAAWTVVVEVVVDRIVVAMRSVVAMVVVGVGATSVVVLITV